MHRTAVRTGRPDFILEKRPRNVNLKITWRQKAEIVLFTYFSNRLFEQKLPVFVTTSNVVKVAARSYFGLKTIFNFILADRTDWFFSICVT